MANIKIENLIRPLPLHSQYSIMCFDSKIEQVGPFLPAIRTLFSESPLDKRIHNYRDVTRIIADSVCVTLVFDSNQNIVGFSTAMANRWQGKVTRVLSRTFYSKSHRSKTLRGQWFPNIATAFMLPAQVLRCQELGCSNFFVSFEYSNRRKFIESVFDELNRHWTYGVWKLAPHLYNVCEKSHSGEVNNDSPCWQSVVYLDLGQPFMETYLPHVECNIAE